MVFNVRKYTIKLHWSERLTGRLSPDFKTIADFRKDNGVAIKKVCSKFVVLCRHMGMFTESVIAVDGSKFKAVNSRDNNYTERKLKARILQTEKRVARYLEELDKADQQGDSVPEARVDHLKTRLKEAKALLNRLDTLDTQLKESPDSQVSMTDPMHARWPPAVKEQPLSGIMFSLLLMISIILL